VGSEVNHGGNKTVDGSQEIPARLALLSSMDDETVAATLAGEWDGEEEDEVPDRVDRYLVLDRLGAGAMGQVYAAYDPDLDRKLALKLLLREDQKTNHRTIRMLREAQALARVSHPNVIQVYDVGTFEGRVYIAMEYIDGQDLGSWLLSKTHTVSEILEVFVQAGRGLEAAHRKHLVHRDFKPENVLVARDGRVVVLDFGIAYAVRRAEHHDDDEALRSRVLEQSSVQEASGKESLLASMARVPGGRAREPSGLEPFDPEATQDAIQAGDPEPRLEAASAFDAELTRVGALVGTPAYMSPEQLEGRGADERSDQFSFCVALWEALHGERPYPGKSPLALWQAMRDGKIRAPRRARVPKWIQRALHRGLSTDPAARFAEVGALLTVLQRDPARIRKRVAVAGLALGALAFGIWGRVSAPEPEPVCAGAEARMTAVWGPERRAALGAAFESSGEQLAALALPGVLTGLDRYAEQWQAMYTDACEATHVRNEQSAELLDLRMACLAEREQALDALVEVLLEPDATVIENSYAAVSALRPVDACANVEALRAKVSLPEDPALLVELEAIERELSLAKARRDAGDHTRALELARAALARAARSDYPPIQADARIEVGRAQIDAGEFDAAATSLRQGFYRALSARDDEAAITAATALVQVTGDRQQDFAEAHNWLGIADALLARQGPSLTVVGQARVELQYLRGVVLWRQDELDQSRAELEQALALARELGEGQRLLEIRVRKGLGSTLWSQGEAEAAADQFQAVVDALSRELGPSHPQVGSALNNLASAHYTLGKRELAEAEFVQTLAIYESCYGDEHPSVANSLNNLAVVYTRAGKLQEARETHLRVIGIHERTLSPEHPELANSWSNLGRVLRRLHEYEDAARYYEKAYERRRQALGEEHSDTLTSLGGLGLSLIELGEHEAGISKLEAVLETQLRLQGPEHPSVTELQREFGEALVAIGRLREGEALLRASLEARARTLDPAHIDVAESLAALVHALVALGELGEALTTCERFYAIEAAAKPANLTRARVRLDHALALRQRGAADEARAHIEQAQKLLAGAEGPDARALRRELATLDTGH
jgi:serine/threonine protein kinase/tetratricopeptide (TPR) repeat protein